MARVFRNFRELSRELLGVANVGRVFTSNALRDLGDMLTKRIVKRTRLGKGVERDGAPETKLKRLAPSTIRHRAYLKRKGKLSNLTNPRKSNQTMTGEMLDSLTFRTRPAKIEIFFDEEYQARKAFWNAQMGRKFMFISDKERRMIVDFSSELLDNYIDQRL